MAKYNDYLFMPPLGGEMELKMSQNFEFQDKMRIVQELVPGRQITLAHIIANPDPTLYQKLGLDPKLDYEHAAIGVLTVSPAETAVITADIALKSSGADLGFVDRFSGTLIITGKVAEVEASFTAITEYFRNILKFSVCEMTRT